MPWLKDGTRMAFETLLWVRKTSTGNAASRSVLRVLADHAGQDHSCYLRTRLIAAETDLSEAGVRGALARLVEAGFVRVFERRHANGSRRTNRYQLLPDGPETPEPDAEDWADVRQAPLQELEGVPQELEGGTLQELEGLPIKEATVLEAPLLKDRAPRLTTATRIPDDFIPDVRMRDWFADEKLHHVIDARIEHERFMDYWRAVPGAKGRKLDWAATWRNWMRTAADRAPRRPVSAPPGTSLMPSTGAPQLSLHSTTNKRVLEGLAIAEKFRQMEENQP